MKVLLLLLISLPVYSNTFELKDTSERFTLDITPERLFYKSEIMSHNVKLGECGLELAKEINAGLLKAAGAQKGTVDFYVDGKKFRAPSSEVSLMDAKIMSFLLNEKSLCQ